MSGLSGFSFVSCALLGVGALEALWGAYALLLPDKALTLVAGQLLSVGASVSPALLPSIAQGGALRLALGLLAVAAAAAPEAADFVGAAVVAHTCVLQPLAVVCRSHVRMPKRDALTLSLLEGAVLVGAIFADLDFDVDALMLHPFCLASAAFFLIGLLLSLLAFSRATCLVGKTGDDGLPALSTGNTPLLFDDNRHKLSPTAKRLLN
jgi:hypothetical protein